ncbi:MAG TPA: hypothetical protein VFW07_08215 [Parafilimonas sp.]|nr:hypothetical protein [Parafilimonas sp.]
MRPIKPLAFLFICALSLFTLTANAGNGYGKGHNKDKQNKGKHEGKKVPIDGGISLLVVAGAAFGAKRIFQKNQKDTLETQL